MKFKDEKGNAVLAIFLTLIVISMIAKCAIDGPPPMLRWTRGAIERTITSLPG